MRGRGFLHEGDIIGLSMKEAGAGESNSHGSQSPPPSWAMNLMEDKLLGGGGSTEFGWIAD